MYQPIRIRAARRPSDRRVELGAARSDCSAVPRDASGCLLSRSTDAVAQVGAGAFEDFVGEGGVGVGDGT